MPKAIKFMVAGTALFLLLVVGFVAYLAWELRPQPPTSELPALVRDLPGRDLTDAEKAFRDRVRKKFPEGVSAQALAGQLRRDGFKLGKISNTFMTESLSNASVKQSGGMCLRRWMISWHTDRQGYARDIKSSYGIDCP
jgi:hypothetical protein